MSSKMNPLHRRGLSRLGAIMVPGQGDLPSFKAKRAAELAPKMLDSMYPQDRDGVLLVLLLCALLPKFVIVALLKACGAGNKVPGPLGAVLRMANLGIKGVVYTLYYSDLGAGPSVFGPLKWNPKIVIPEGNEV